MARTSGKNRYPFDAELLLRAENAAAITASADSSDFNLTFGSGNDVANEYVGAKQDFVIVVHVTAIDTSSDETYVLGVKVGNGTTSKVINSTAVNAVGVYVLPVNREQLEGAVAKADRVAVSATLGGTTPSLDYFAYVAPSYGIQH